MADSDTDDWSPRPRTRPTLGRAAKTKVPVTPTRATRSTTARLSSVSASTPSPSPEPLPFTPIRSLRSRGAKRKLPETPPHPASPTPARPVKRTKLQVAKPRPITSSQGVSSLDVHHDGDFPRWKSLPSEIWMNVFDCLALPIREHGTSLDDVTDSVMSLLAAARVCKKTTEPALSALYRCLPFDVNWLNKASQTSFLQFFNTISRDPSETLIKYRSKVKTLRLNADTFLSRKIGGDLVTLRKLIQDLPNLGQLELYHPADEPPYKDLSLHLRCKFTRDALLEALEPVVDENSTRDDKLTTIFFKSWRWNSRLVNDTLALDQLSQMHHLPSFQSLRKVAYVNYQLPSLTHFTVTKRESREAAERDQTEIAHMAASISALPALRHLIIESSTLANGELLSRLPNSLEHLELVNCWEVTSDNFTSFLLSHGSSLTHLTLKHCQALSLGFLIVLETACPRLTHLEIDFSYFRHYGSYADNKPEYDILLEENQIPKWPSSIQSIEMIHMRNWTRESAEMFFNSLMNNAESLPNLRRLVFKVILDIEWRQRQEVRQALADRMDQVFKRRCSPPQIHQSINRTKSQGPTDVDNEQPAARRSVRILKAATKSHLPNSLEVDELTPRRNPDSNVLHTRNRLGKLRISEDALPHISAPLTTGVRRSTRILRNTGATRSTRNTRSASTASDADGEESSEDELARDYTDSSGAKHTAEPHSNGAASNEIFIQGLCDIVEIHLDNQRPTERQFREEEFISPPPSDDSDAEYRG